jgi:hypothetical protein
MLFTGTDLALDERGARAALREAQAELAEVRRSLRVALERESVWRGANCRSGRRDADDARLVALFGTVARMEPLPMPRSRRG